VDRIAHLVSSSRDLSLSALKLGETILTYNVVDNAGSWNQCMDNWSVTLVDADRIDKPFVDCGVAHDYITNRNLPVQVVPSVARTKDNGCPVEVTSDDFSPASSATAPAC
jgi:hypothetical protein